MEPGRSGATELRRGTVAYCVLALLAETERYAVEVVRDLAGSGVIAAGQGTVYPLLARLRREGLVSTTWQESSSGPPRRYYRITPAGSAALDAFRVEWQELRDAVDRLLWKGTT